MNLFHGTRSRIHSQRNYFYQSHGAGVAAPAARCHVRADVYITRRELKGQSADRARGSTKKSIAALVNAVATCGKNRCRGEIIALSEAARSFSCGDQTGSQGSNSVIMKAQRTRLFMPALNWTLIYVKKQCNPSVGLTTRNVSLMFSTGAVSLLPCVFNSDNISPQLRVADKFGVCNTREAILLPLATSSARGGSCIEVAGSNSVHVSFTRRRRRRRGRRRCEVGSRIRYFRNVRARRAATSPTE